MRKLKHSEIKRLSNAEYEVAEKHPIAVLVDNIRSAHNLGSILRTSDAAGIEQVYLTGITPPVDHKMVHKTALGAQDTVCVTRTDNPSELVGLLRSRGYKVAALELTDTPSRIADLKATDFPLLLIVGNELHGVSTELIDLCDMALEIPQYGTKHSLNVSVASGIAIFALVDKFLSTRNRSPVR